MYFLQVGIPTGPSTRNLSSNKKYSHIKKQQLNFPQKFIRRFLLISFSSDVFSYLFLIYKKELSTSRSLLSFYSVFNFVRRLFYHFTVFVFSSERGGRPGPRDDHLLPSPPFRGPKHFRGHYTLQSHLYCMLCYCYVLVSYKFSSSS